MAMKLTANTTTGVATTSITTSTSPQHLLSSELRTSSWQPLCLLKSSRATRPQSPLQMNAKPQLLFVRRMRLSVSQSVVTSFAPSSMSRSNQSVRHLASLMTALAPLAMSPKKACTQFAPATPTASAPTTCSTWTRNATA